MRRDRVPEIAKENTNPIEGRPRKRTRFHDTLSRLFFAEQLAAACDAHNCRMFVVQNLSERKNLLLTVLSHKHYIAAFRHHREEGGGAGSRSLLPAIKLAYEIVSKEKVHDWAATNRAEVWVEPTNHCERLISVLRASSESFRSVISSGAQMGGRTIAFLHRLSL
mmetsp:Transcript_8662/g.11917  ORF Transcript_8662/g.11917 Transcript_8662/m.11917 type:complete len:165 (-) Transcript_8662:90-584(-)